MPWGRDVWPNLVEETITKIKEQKKQSYHGASHRAGMDIIIKLLEEWKPNRSEKLMDGIERALRIYDDHYKRLANTMVIDDS